MRSGTRLIVDLSLLKKNIELLKKEYAPENEIIFMIKADAYGHGIEQVLEYSFTEAGIKIFGVASFEEALFCRKALPELDFDIWVFSDLALFENKSNYQKYKITPVLHDIEQVEIFNKNIEFKSLPLVIKFNTGMNRLGISEDELSELIILLKNHNIKSIDHIMTHLSSSYLPKKSDDMTSAQLLRFEKIKEELKKNDISFKASSCANSGAIEQKRGLEESHIRPGLMLYGPQSTFTKKRLWKGSLISKLEVRILKISTLKSGETFGYGNTRLSEDGYLINLAIGYGDGISTSLQNTYLKHLDLQIKGRVNMDMLFLFSKTKPKLSVGDQITLWSEDYQQIQELCEASGRIPYEILTNITQRVPRVYNK